METLNFIWQEICVFFSQQKNIVSVLWLIYGLAWGFVFLQLCLLPYKIKRVRLKWHSQQGLVFQGDAFYIKVRKIKL